MSDELEAPTRPPRTNYTINTTVPLSVEDEIKALGYPHTSDAVRALLREALDARAREEANDAVLSCTVTADVASRIRERATEQGLTVDQWLRARALHTLARTEAAPQRNTPARPRKGPYTASVDEDQFTVPSGDVLPSTEPRRARDGHAL